MASYDIIMPCTANYHWELQPFKMLFDRFWDGQPAIKLFGDKDPNLDGIQFFNARVPDRRQSDWIARFTDNLIEFLIHDCHSPFFVLMMSDYWITQKVSTKWLQYIADYMTARGDIIRMQISNGMDGFGDAELVAELDDVRIRNPLTFLRGSLIPGMWSRELLLKYLERGQTMWQMEIELSKTIEATSSIHSYAALPYAIWYEHCARTRIKACCLQPLPSDIQAEVAPMIPVGYEVIY